jgi:O-antigen/teichoic acid export membrane protein
VAAHLQRTLVWISGCALLVNVAANFALIPSASYVGAAVATVLTEGLALVLSMEVLRRRCGLRRTPRGLWRVAGAVAVMGAALVPGYALAVPLQLCLGLMGLAVGVWATRPIRMNDLREAGLRVGRTRLGEVAH